MTAALHREPSAGARPAREPCRPLILAPGGRTLALVVADATGRLADRLGCNGMPGRKRVDVGYTAWAWLRPASGTFTPGG